MGVLKMNRDAWKLKIYKQHYVQKHHTHKDHEEDRVKSLHMIQTLKLMQLAELLKWNSHVLVNLDVVIAGHNFCQSLISREISTQLIWNMCDQASSRFALLIN